MHKCVYCRELIQDDELSQLNHAMKCKKHPLRWAEFVVRHIRSVLKRAVEWWVDLSSMNQQQSYTTTQITKSLGIQRERLKDWMARGFISPTIPAEGSGTKAVFTIKDFCTVYMFKLLIDFGFKREVASDLARLFVEAAFVKMSQRDW